MDIKEKVLKGREERALLINGYLIDFSTVISIKANIAGYDKKNFLSYMIINAFTFLINEFKDSKHYYHSNDDGPFIIIVCKERNALSIKNKILEIEEKHELGRLVDIDVYNKKGKISRNVKRKCYICDDNAFNCVRTNKHKYEEVMEYITDKTNEYYQKRIYELIDFSILSELNLDPKFGLVTPVSSGSHKDMDYFLMIEAKNAIIHYLIEMFFVSCQIKDINKLIHALQEIGLRAETDMFSITKGVNAYKGLIFNLGLMVSCFGYKISQFTTKNIFDLSKDFSNILFKDYKYETSSYGDIFYRKYQLSGIKGEALAGFIHVQEGLEILKDFSWNSRINTLVYYIINIEDTSFLKRAKSLEYYYSVKDMFTKLNTDNIDEIKSLNDYCIKNQLTFGGSADLLVLTVFTKKIKDFWLKFTG
ncbi:MAG: triphosphoribosyl-dephospho-CoA synthase [Candidatus Izemoplasmatales bacterium]|nr:triphosphoribosyl-dephospho-CoA synthase [Candidatus Izemoplasmatales bacterium]